MELRLGGRPIGLPTILRSKKAAWACSYNARSAQEKNPSARKLSGRVNFFAFFQLPGYTVLDQED